MTTASSVRTSWPGPPRRRRRAERERWNGMRLLLGLLALAVGLVAVGSFIEAVAFPGPLPELPTTSLPTQPAADTPARTTAEPTADGARPGVGHGPKTRRAGTAAPSTGSPRTRAGAGTRAPARPSPSALVPAQRSGGTGGTRSTPAEDDKSDASRQDSDDGATPAHRATKKVVPVADEDSAEGDETARGTSSR